MPLTSNSETSFPRSKGAVANTVKRVVILLATVAFLGESMDVHKASGAAVAIGATMMYSIAKTKK